MLVEFKIKNFRSIKDEVVLSLFASSDTTLPDNCIQFQKSRLLKAAAIYGPNASGKSNIVTALRLVHNFVRNSTKDEWKQIPLKPFLFSSETRSAPSEFELTFIVNDVRYQFGFKATEDRVVEEWLYAFPKRKPQLWYSRKRANDTFEAHDDWQFGSFLRGDKIGLSQKTRSNSLFLSVAAQWNHEQLTPVASWFSTQIRIIETENAIPWITAKMLLEASEDKDSAEMREFVVKFLGDADLGVKDISVVKDSKRHEIFKELLPEPFLKDIRKQVEDQITLKVTMTHLDSESGESTGLDLADESRGTQKMFHLAGPLLVCQASSALLIFDEFESSLHPLLSRELLKFFMHARPEKSTSQMVFTTHDTSFLDPELLRRDQIWFTERDHRGETKLYPMSDFSVRKGEAIQKGYLSGRYGALPVLRAFGIEDGETAKT